MYEIQLVASAAKEFRSIPPSSQGKIIKTINKLSSDPRHSGYKKLKGKVDLYRVRSGVYRLIYKINDENKTILIT